ncbi:hypothetical protein SE23_09160 [Vibrio sinaloensis]|uniref:Uncharacterized protein n=2 Tax=Vibrio TaxID=662 RepID=A0A1G8EQT0_9VIBR|nr:MULTISPECIES: hypothetical protein [Vibrio]KIE20929.1 hypothetical protein SE23_09160 [Vibrio sinaloensis]TOQ30199.1 hypothetical protein CGG97_24095 [Vibrio parahaemolyticus]SDH72250.1 hypothetical protein SAMN04488136_12614 [Vibrio xiamenensis]HCE2456345.1 hypothetical protein [Vibrio parahaemolyticus]
MLANMFAHYLEMAWKQESQKANFSEIKQFRALMDSFASLNSTFRLEEFHGMKHQVVFNGQGSWGRNTARCEISDLLIVSYKKTPSFEARVTLLQAKRSLEKHDLCSSWTSGSCSTSFKANLEQWDLLARRPNVLPYPPFDCHPEILSGAELPSIGSIGVFHKIKGKEYNFFYMSADCASPLSNPTTKYAKLKVHKLKPARMINGYKECTFACCINTFGEALYNLEIGTPVHDEKGLSKQSERYRNNLRGWLKMVLMSHIEMTSPDSSLAREFEELLDTDFEGEFMHQPPNLILINCDN